MNTPKTAQIIPFKPRSKQEKLQEGPDDFVESIKYCLFELPPEQFYQIRDWMNSFWIKL